MNNKELTELKKEFEGKFRDVKLADRVETISVVDKDGNLVGKKEIWSFFLPHLKSNDEIKREALSLEQVLAVIPECKILPKDQRECGYNQCRDEIVERIQHLFLTQSKEGGE